MGKIILVLGRTGAGKSTLCQKLADTFQAKLLSFAKCGKNFAALHGYKYIRKCYNELGPEQFKKLFSDYFEDIIIRAIEEYPFVIIDGLYVYEIAKHLKNKYNVPFLYIDVPLEVCFERIAKRESMTIEQVQAEYASKEIMKQYLGNELIINMSDCVINGDQDSDTVYSSVVAWMNTL